MGAGEAVFGIAVRGAAVGRITSLIEADVVPCPVAFPADELRSDSTTPAMTAAAAIPTARTQAKVIKMILRGRFTRGTAIPKVYAAGRPHRGCVRSFREPEYGALTAGAVVAALPRANEYQKVCS